LRCDAAIAEVVDFVVVQVSVERCGYLYLGWSTIADYDRDQRFDDLWLGRNDRFRNDDFRFGRWYDNGFRRRFRNGFGLVDDRFRHRFRWQRDEQRTAGQGDKQQYHR
jgi:hypothetical protein